MLLKRVSATIGIIAVAVPTAYGAERAVRISKAEYGDKWPFTVSSGRLGCVSGNKVVFHASGVAYAVNGTASSDKRYRNIRPIWKDNPKIAGTKVPISSVLKRGLNLCGR